MEDTLTAAGLQPPLYDLLARPYTLAAPARSLCFDRAGKSCAFSLDDGRLAIVGLEDAESPLKRLRREADSGRSLIRPREKPVAAPVYTPIIAMAAPLLCASNRLGYLVADAEGTLQRVTPRGQVLPLARPAGPLRCLASDGRGQLALAGADWLQRGDEASPKTASTAPLPAPPTALQHLGRSGALAIRAGEALWVQDAQGQTEAMQVGAGSGLAASANGDWLAGGTDSGFWLYHRTSGRLAQLHNFPAAPQSLCFSADAVFVAGAYRLTGWSLATPPFDAPATGALRSGGQSMVLTSALAAHPHRSLIATGWTDGGVSLIKPGAVDEMVLRHGEGAAVTAIAWSDDGLHLALITADGKAALITLPPQLFR